MKKSRHIPLVMTLMVTACLPTVPEGPPTGVPTTTVPPTTAVPTSGFVVTPTGGDDTAVFVDAVKSYPKVVVNKPLKIDNIAAFSGITQKNITFEGNGKLVRSVLNNPSGDLATFPVLQFQGGSDVTLVNPQIEGPSSGCKYISTYEESAAIRLNGVTRFTVQGGLLKNMPGDGIEIFYNWLTNPSTPSSNVTINDVTINCVGRASIANVSSTNVTINRGSYDNAGRWIFNVEPFNALYVRDYIVNQPIVGYSASAWLFVGGPYFQCGAVTNIKFNQVSFLGPHFDKVVKPCAQDQVAIV